jgi:hypothetical protein
MATRALSQPQIEQLAAEGAAQLRKERAASALAIVNVRLATTLDDDDVLVWRDGREYRVPPVPWDAGAELLEIQMALLRMSQNDQADMRQYRILMRRAVEIFPRLIRRPFRALRPNPFRTASAPEVGALLGFFLASPTSRLRAESLT